MQQILLKFQLQIDASSPSEFIAQARGILTHQNELETMAQSLQAQIDQLEAENRALVGGSHCCFQYFPDEKKEYYDFFKEW